jgi:hypothetical protein
MQHISEILPTVINDIQYQKWGRLITEKFLKELQEKDKVNRIKGQFAEMEACNA